MSGLGARISRNPVLRRELLERWRGNRATMVVTGYVAVLAALTLLLAWIGVSFLEDRFQFDGGAAGAGPLLGRFLVENLLAFTMGLSLLLAPAYASTQISGERERKTLALLRITLVKPGQIVLGKLGASVAWLLLLTVAAVPLMALGFFLGGITFPQLLRGLFTMFAMTVAVAAIGIGISSMTKRSTPALVIMILTVGAISIGTLFMGLVEGVARDFNFNGGKPVSTLINPYVALADAVDADNGAQFFGAGLESILTGFGTLIPQDQPDFFNGGFDQGFERGFIEEDFAVAVAPGFEGGGIFLDEPNIVDINDNSGRRDTPYWLLTSAFYLMIGAFFLLIAASRVGKADIE